MCHKNHIIKTNQVLRRTEERHNYSCNKTREVPTPVYVYKVAKMSYQQLYTNIIVCFRWFFPQSIFTKPKCSSLLAKEEGKYKIERYAAPTDLIREEIFSMFRKRD